MQTKSKYSQYFRHEENVMICIPCEKNHVVKKYNMYPGYGTSHLRRHLLNHHQILVDVINTGPFSSAVADLVINCALPFAVTQTDDFHNVIQKARENIQEEIPSIGTTTEIIHTKYVNECSQLKKELKDAQYASIIIDHWTSSDCKNYAGIIIAFVDNSFRLKYKMIDFNMVGEHGALYTHETMKTLCKNFGVYSKLSGVVGDSTSSMLNTLQLTANDSSSLKHVCICHVFQLAINAALNDENNEALFDTLTIAKKMVNFIRSSTKFIHFAIERASNRGEKFRIPRKDNQTRWDSKFLMIESIVHQIDELNLALQEFSKKEKVKVPKMDQKEIDVLVILYNTLAMFRNVTVQAQSNDRSIGSLIPMYYYISTCCTKCKDSEFTYIQKFGNIVQDEFNVRVQKHYMVNFLWKEEYVVSAFLEISSKKFMKALDTEGDFEKCFKSFVDINALYNPRQTPNFEVPCRKKPILSYDQMVRGITNASELTVYDEIQETNVGVSEVTVFLTDCSNDHLSNFEWWKRNRKRYPFLANFAKKFLSIPISSAAIERGFSHAKAVLKVSRSQLLEFKHKELLILKVNSCSKA